MSQQESYTIAFHSMGSPLLDNVASELSGGPFY